jgi:nucleoside-diphosphate-sugar epimerase
MTWHEVTRIVGQAGDRRSVFDVGGPEAFTLNEIYREIAAAVGKPGKPLFHLPLWWGGSSRGFASGSRGKAGSMPRR